MPDETEASSFNFGERLRTIREQVGLSQESFGMKIGRGQRDISRYERNQVKPDIEVVRSICLEFEVGPDFLLDLSPVRLKDDLTRNAWRAAQIVNSMPLEDQETAVRLLDVLKQELELRKSRADKPTE